MINHEHTAAVGGSKGKRMPDAQLPYIDHLSVDQLRQRAADDRSDALEMIDRASAGRISMLLEDAERCETRATLLEQRCGDSIAAGLDGLTLDGLTIENAIEQLVRAARGRMVGEQPGHPASPITGIQADILHDADHGAAVRSLTSMAVRRC
ncbi:hypothetical protein ABMY26_22605 [Azospirillum sp. HJ39]|uniref:hypothetical protein n=1 Tax=Azospirillum sp. HJ39 TaxID=3159496 RepID=UPI003557E218